MVGHHLHGDVHHTLNLRFAPDWAQLGFPGYEVVADQVAAGGAGESASAGPTEVTAAIRLVAASHLMTEGLLRG
jgi:hypothetical protein